MPVAYKCPNCDAGLSFDPGRQAFHCDFCRADFTQAQLEAQGQTGTAVQEATGTYAPLRPSLRDPALQNANAGAADEPNKKTDTGEEAAVYNCPNCGAQVLCDPTLAATHCYYCHNPVVLAGRLKGEYLPDIVLPFTLTREQAQDTFFNWVKRKHFVPSGYFSPQQVESLTGVYFPYWIMDCDVTAALSGRATTSRTWQVGKMVYTETRHFQVERAGDIHFEDITKNALKKANRKLVDGVLPFESTRFLPFSMTYLSGFQAEKRDIEKAEMQADTDHETDEYARNLLRDTVTGYQTVAIEKSGADIRNVNWQYALLPVWVLAYLGRKQLYHFSINGQTGKVCGELPVSGFKAGLLAAGVLAGVLAAGALLWWLL